MYRSSAIVLVLLITLDASLARVEASESPSESYQEEIVVTADFRDTTVANLPGSATVITPNTDGTVVHHLDELLSRAPNVNFASGASRGRFIQIRGIGERGQFSTPLNSSVGLIIDGIDMSGVGTAATLFDVQQVEVLRGPQGTLYGANALAGLINVVTPSYTDVQTAKVRLDAGDYGTFGAGGVISGPIGESAGYRISAQRYRDDGFIDNEFLGRDNTNNHDETTYRGKFSWRTDLTSWSLVFGHVDVDNGYDAFSLDNDRDTQSDEPGHDQQTTDYAGLALRWDFSETTELEANVSLSQTDVDYGYDEDWTFTGFDAFGYTSTDRYERERDTVTAEVRALSKPGQGLGNGTWDWVAGAYLLDQEVSLARTYTFDSPFSSEFEIQRLAIYGELSREISERWRLSLGARVEQHSADYQDARGVSYDPNDNLFGGRILLERAQDDGSLIYTSITQGYKSGGFNIDGTLAPDLREFDPETLWNIELGYKAKWFDERLKLRTALFRMERDDIQISTSTERPIPGLAAVEFIVYTGNAAEGFNQGVEAEMEFAATDTVTLFANIGILDSEYEDYTDNSGRNLDGREQAHAPSYQFFAGAMFRFTESWTAQIEIEGKDEFFFSASHGTESDTYELVNASLAYTSNRWQARIWARNLTDEDYFVRGFFFGNDPRDGYTARSFTQLGEPARFGVSFEMQL
ncbi:MAG: TonB-dependent receptor plug domain-containing protein [Pseudomonadales bacterium]|nr:TonB-dependent receptor plug domain-containing protein [Pseudomonadales bacterium]